MQAKREVNLRQDQEPRGQGHAWLLGALAALDRMDGPTAVDVSERDTGILEATARDRTGAAAQLD